MEWSDIACIVFICVTANHMGLIEAVEEKAGREILILNCVKCSVFWFVLIYSLISSGDIIVSLAISFLSSYCALWIELFEVFIDTFYLKLYGTVTEKDGGDKTATDPAGGAAESSVPDMRKEERKEKEVKHKNR